MCERLECICEKTISPPGERAPSPPPSQVRARAKSDFPHDHSVSPSLALSPPFPTVSAWNAPRSTESAARDRASQRGWDRGRGGDGDGCFSLSGAHAAFLPMLAPLRSLLRSQCEFGRDRVRTYPAPRGTTIALDGRKEGHVLHRLIRKGQKRLQGKTATVPFPLLPSGLLRMDAEKFAEGRERSTFLHRGRINNCEALRGPRALLAHRRRYQEMRSRVH